MLQISVNYQLKFMKNSSLFQLGESSDGCFEWISSEKSALDADRFLHWELTLAVASLETKMSASLGESLRSIAAILLERVVSCERIAANAWLFEPDDWPATTE